MKCCIWEKRVKAKQNVPIVFTDTYAARTQFCSKKSILAAKKNFHVTKITFAMILSQFETIDWANKIGYKNFVSVGL